MTDHQDDYTPSIESRTSENGVHDEEPPPYDPGEEPPDHTDEVFEAALLYARMGIPVLPIFGVEDGRCQCRNAECTKPGKHPNGRLAPRGHLNATTDESTIRDWFTQEPGANIGIGLVEPGLVIVGPDTPEWEEEFQEKGLPATATAQSGGGEGHLHHYYRRPDGCPLHRICHSGKFDIVSEGYIIAPPSLHASGRRYTWLTPLSGDLPDAPDWVVKALATRATASGDFTPIDPNQPPVRLVGKALQRWEGTLLAQHPDGTLDRSHSLTLIAYDLAKAGLTRRGIVDGLRDRDLHLWPEPKYANRTEDQEGKRLVELADGALAETVKATRQSGFTILSNLDVMALPPPEWLIDQLLVEGTVAQIAGEPGSLKSFVALDICYHVALGWPWCGHHVNKPGPTLYIAGEGFGGLGVRMKAWQQWYDVEGEAIGVDLVNSAVDFNQAGQVTMLLDTITQKNKAYQLVVVDTRKLNSLSARENDNDDMQRVLLGMERIANAVGSSILVIHHVARSSGKERGATSFGGGAQTLITASTMPGLTVVLEINKQRDGPEIEAFALKAEVVRLESGLTSLVLRPTDITIQDTSHQDKKKAFDLEQGEKDVARALMTLQTIGGEVPYGEWQVACRAAGLLKRRFDNAVKVLLENHKVDRRKDGINTFYWVVVEGAGEGGVEDGGVDEDGDGEDGDEDGGVEEGAEEDVEEGVVGNGGDGEDVVEEGDDATGEGRGWHALDQGSVHDPVPA